VINANGTAGNDTILAFESAGHGLVQIGDGSVLLDASGMSKLALNGLGGEDTLRLQNGQGQLPVVLDGGEGNDLLFGGNFGDKLLGGPGNDVVQGGQGADNIFPGRRRRHLRLESGRRQRRHRG
jgi:Ca2+-binding RTX toxin-like protein